MARISICLFLIIYTVFGIVFQKQSYAAGNANYCVSWNSPKSGFVVNNCSKAIDILWQDQGNCTAANCMIGVQPGDTYTAGVHRLGPSKFVACFKPDYVVRETWSCRASSKDVAQPRKKPIQFANSDQAISYASANSPTCDRGWNQCHKRCEAHLDAPWDGTKGFRSCSKQCAQATLNCVNSALAGGEADFHPPYDAFDTGLGSTRRDRSSNRQDGYPSKQRETQPACARC